MKFVGGGWHKQRRKWQVRIDHDGKGQHLGYFNDEQEVARAIDMVAWWLSAHQPSFRIVRP